MGDYISRDYAVENMENYPWDTEHDKNAAIHLVRELVPAADVRPVVRGYWKPVRESEISGYDPALSGQDPIYMHICSNCGIDSYLDENGQELLTAFCPMCGADMREETDA